MHTDDPAKLEAALEQLEAERQRRIDERVEKGEAVFVPCGQALVIGGRERVEAVVAEYKASELARLRKAGEKREVHFEEPMVIVTGVPRAGRDEEYYAALARGDHFCPRSGDEAGGNDALARGAEAQRSPADVGVGCPLREHERAASSGVEAVLDADQGPE